MEYADFINRILLSIALGLAIGVERQMTGHPAGVRANVLICMGTCFFLLMPSVLGQSAEVPRLAGSVVAGLGFICSGVIFKEGVSVRGIHTAATLWCSSAIGMLSSTGLYLYAVSAAGILLFCNIVLRPLVYRITPLIAVDEAEKQYRVSVVCSKSNAVDVRAMLSAMKPGKSFHLISISSSDSTAGQVEVRAIFKCSGHLRDHLMEGSVSELLRNPIVLGAGWEHA